ncbi:cadmium-exporting ATPase [Clostridium sp. CAG:609]|nr:cadmium-exporting ATPase [Clostridium sp. CAG:609]
MKKIKFNEDLIRILISAILLIISIFLKNFKTAYLIVIVVSYVLVSKEVYENALKNIKKKEIFDENLLMIIATLGAFYIKEYPEAVLVMLLFSLGEYLSSQAVDNSKKAIIELMDLRSDKTRLKNGELVSTKKVKLNDIIIVNPGEKIPLDGIIINGASHLDTKNLTGESKPLSVKKGDTVLSGTINIESILEINSTSTYKTSTASKIIDIMEHADEKKAKTEKFITKFSKIYTPIVVLLSILIVVIPTILGCDFNTWLYRALEMLVISCPCALVISVPLSYFAGIGRASKDGILIKGSNELDNLSNIKTILFDKTGTLTKGVFEVTKINGNINEVLKIAANAEAHSNHPIGKSIVSAYNKTLDMKITDYKEIAGLGISCKLNKEKVLVGKIDLLLENNIDVDKIDSVGTVIYVAKNNECIGSIIISDKIKDNAKETLEDLRGELVENLVVLSGDKDEVVEDLAKTLNLDAYHAELLPEDKIKLLEEYQIFGQTAFVGDGINDAPVIKLSDIGIAMGKIGSDATVDASDIVLMNDDLSSITKAIRISKLTKRVILSNIIFAISFKLLMLVLAIIGITPIYLAVFADVGVTLLSVLNSLRIFKKDL